MRKFFIILGGCILFFYIVFIAFYFPLKFGYTLSNSKQDWAYYSTYVSGLITPIFALGAFTAALYSYGLNRKQSALNTIIKQIDFHYTILQGIEIIIKQKDIERIDIALPKGRDYVSGKVAFEALYYILDQNYREKGRIKKYSETLTGMQERIVDSFDQLYLDYGNQIGNYFKNLYLLIDYINKIDANRFDKAYHIDLIKAQLSKYEILLLAYDCIWIQDKPPGTNFINYAKKHRLLSSLETNELIRDEESPINWHERLFNYRYGIYFERPQLKIKTKISQLRFKLLFGDKYIGFMAGWLTKNHL